MKPKVFICPQLAGNPRGPSERFRLTIRTIDDEIEKVSIIKDADIIIYAGGELYGKNFNTNGKPVIIWDTNDNSHFNGYFIHAMRHWNVKAILKRHSIKKEHLKVSKDRDVMGHEALTSEQKYFYDKFIDVIFPISSYVASHHIYDGPVCRLYTPLDVFFSGTVLYNGVDRETPKHRKALMKELEHLKSEKGYSIFANGSRNITKPTYWNYLLTSKLSISPWGWGAVCVRDFESLACGCKTIKPYCGWVNTYPDIYNEEWFYWCDYGWYSLDIIVENALSDTKPYPDTEKFKKVCSGWKEHNIRMFHKALELI